MSAWRVSGCGQTLRVAWHRAVAKTERGVTQLGAARAFECRLAHKKPATALFQLGDARFWTALLRRAWRVLLRATGRYDGRLRQPSPEAALAPSKPK